MEMMSMDDSECIINVQDADDVLASNATPFDSYYGSPSSAFSPDLSPYDSTPTFDFPHTPPRPISRRSSDSASSFQMPHFHHSPSMSSTPDFSSNATFHNASPLRVDTNMAHASPYLSPMSAYGGSLAFASSPNDDIFLSPYANPQSNFSNSTSSLESLLLTPDDGRGRSLGRDQGLLSPIQMRSRESSVSSITHLAAPFPEDCDPASPGSYTSTSETFESDFSNSMMLNSPSEMPKPLEPGGCLDPRVELATSESESSPVPERTKGRFRKNVASDAVKKASAERRKHDAPHKCDKCGQTFTAKHNLINHGNSHAGLKPFKCKYCPGAFGTSGVLARHVKKRHDELDSDVESPRARVKARRIGKRTSS